MKAKQASRPRFSRIQAGVRRRLETKLTDAEEERLENMYARGPFFRKEVDERLLELGWAETWDGHDDQVNSHPDTIQQYAAYRRRRMEERT